MDASIFIAQFLGTLFLVMGLGMAFHHKHYKTVIHDVVKTPGLKFISGLIPLILGTFFLLCQHSWDGGWHIFVTLITLLIFIKGASRILFPIRSDKGLLKYIEKPSGYKICNTITLVLAVLLCYYGFAYTQMMG